MIFPSQKSHEIEYIDTFECDKLQAMTTVVGIKSTDGIVLSSDSQWTSYPIKDFAISKIFRINDSMGLGVSGTSFYIKILVEELQKIIIDKSTTELGLRKNIDNILTDLFKEKVVERSRKLGYTQINNLFDAIGLLGVKLYDGNFVLYRLRLSPPNPQIDPVDNYDTIGSGASYAQLVLRQQSRAPLAIGKNLADIELNYNIWVAMLTVNEIKSVDLSTGGNTRVAVIDRDGFRELTRNIYEWYREQIANLMYEKVHTTKQAVKALFPDP